MLSLINAFHDYNYYESKPQSDELDQPSQSYM